MGESIELLGIFLMIGLACGGLAVGSGFFRGSMLIGKSLVRAAKIASMAQCGKYFVASDDNNDV